MKNITRKRLVKVPKEKNYVQNLDYKAIFSDIKMQFFLKNLVYLDEL